MIPLTNIHPLTDFKRDTGTFRRRLRKTGLPEVLTVEGRPELVVQDAAAYQQMLDAVGGLDSIERLRRGLADVAAGRTIPADKLLREVRSVLTRKKP